jgi:hypothetical protein
MSALAVVLIVLGVLAILLFAGGLVAARRRARIEAGPYQRHLAEADRALEQARAADRGWDRAAMEQAARRALEEQRQGLVYDRLDLVLVDDRPGVGQDRAHFQATGAGGNARVVLTRREGGWVAERVE